MAESNEKWWVGLGDDQFVKECKRRDIWYSEGPYGPYFATKDEIEEAFTRQQRNGANG